ncbi:HAMP domain-containing sensor histidine kinase [uncultured Hydrogenophaga sp.]|uniref:sensor histidine kinase n=1 Tax=uncultured Hydrogenophaga sp. TaxID=199683 RepID=UPI00258FE57E|nr:HAMP domain-containing sensor histidine kinase [uncultured Hydrogenophaga sp.]
MRFVKMPRLNSLRLKVLLAYVAGMALSITLVVIATFALLRSNALASLDLADAAKDMAEHIRFDGNGQPVGFDLGPDDMSWVFDSIRRETAYRVLDEAGRVALQSSGAEAFWPADANQRGLAIGRFDFERDGVALHGAIERVEHEGKAWYLQMAASTRFMHLLHRVALPLAGVGIVVFGLVLLVAFGLCAFITLRYTLKPLQDVSASAAAISPRSVHARLSTQSVPQEIAPLVDSFNRVLERLEQGYRVQQEFLATSAHELKTPLALIRAQIELRQGPQEGREALLGDVAYMSRQVQQLLLLAEASEPHNYQPATVRVQEVVHEAVFFLQRMAEAAGVHFTVYSPAVDVRWRADRGALFTLLKNLMENAVQHAHVGTDVCIEIQRDTLTVRDHGAGAQADQLPLLFTRFWRGAHRRDKGAGLGLAICQEIALAHGWTLIAERAEPGLRFRLSIRD